MLPQFSYSPAINRNNELAKSRLNRAGILASAERGVVTGRFCSKIYISSHQESSSIFDAQNYTAGARTGQSVDRHASRKYPPALVLADICNL